ncbi:Calpain-A, partial [Operophtera brumata]
EISSDPQLFVEGYSRFDDFTGGVTEMYDVAELPPNFYTILLKAYERNSLMGCSIEPDPNILEAETPVGLIRGHAYSITRVKYVDIETPGRAGKIPLLRLRNPWGNEAEWNGPWSDKSPEWRYIPESEKEELGVTAGGCRNFLESFWRNPQYMVTLKDPDEGDDENKCTIIVALMQKNRRSQRHAGLECLTIGFAVYRLPDYGHVPKPLDVNYFKYNASVGRSQAFINLREPLDVNYFKYNASVGRSQAFINLREVIAARRQLLQVQRVCGPQPGVHQPERSQRQVIAARRQLLQVQRVRGTQPGVHQPERSQRQLDVNYFKYNASVGRSQAFINLREVSARFACLSSGFTCLTIWFVVYHLRDVARRLNSLLYVGCIRILFYSILTPICLLSRFKFEPGTYVIVPSTFDPNEEGDENDEDIGMGDVDDRVKEVSPDPEPADPVRAFFDRLAGADGEVDWQELKEILDYAMREELAMRRGTHGAYDGGGSAPAPGAPAEQSCLEQLLCALCSPICKEIGVDLNQIQQQNQEQVHLTQPQPAELKGQGFSKDVCRSMIAMLDKDGSGGLGFEEFKSLWIDLRNWRVTSPIINNKFRLYDTEGRGAVPAHNLRDALHSAGYTVNAHILNVTSPIINNKFRLYDTEGRGAVPAQNLRDALHSAGYTVNAHILNVTSPIINNKFRLYDTEGRGAVPAHILRDALHSAGYTVNAHILNVTSPIINNKFRLYDTEGRGAVPAHILRDALHSAGYTVNAHILNVLAHRYSGSDGYIQFDDFIMCAVRLKTMIDTFKGRSSGGEYATFSLEEWLNRTVYS